MKLNRGIGVFRHMPNGWKGKIFKTNDHLWLYFYRPQDIVDEEMIRHSYNTTNYKKRLFLKMGNLKGTNMHSF